MSEKIFKITVGELRKMVNEQLEGDRAAAAPVSGADAPMTRSKFAKDAKSGELADMIMKLPQAKVDLVYELVSSLMDAAGSKEISPSELQVLQMVVSKRLDQMGRKEDAPSPASPKTESVKRTVRK